MTLRQAYILSFVGLALVVLCNSQAATAASNSQQSILPTQKISITPNSINEVVQKGSANKGTIDVSDLGASSYNFSVYAAPYSVVGENYSPSFSPIPGTTDIASWFQFSPAQSYIQAKQIIPIKYSLNVPRNTLSGGYYAVVFAKTQSQTSGSGIAINEQVGDIFYLTVAGQAKISGSIKSFAVKFFQKPPINAVLRLENNGSDHYISNIEIKVSDILGKPKYIYQTQKVILPGTIRRFNVSWSSSPGFSLLKINGTATVIGKTKELPTSYVLVMSETARLITGIVIAALLLSPAVIYVITSFLQKKKHTHYRL